MTFTKGTLEKMNKLPVKLNKQLGSTLINAVIHHKRKAQDKPLELISIFPSRYFYYILIYLVEFIS